MSMIGLRCPIEVAEKLSKISVPGKKEKADSLHITMFYFEKELSIKEAIKATQLVYDCIKSAEPFTVKGTKVTCFPKGDDGVPVIVQIESDGLVDLRKKLAKKFDSNDLKYSKKFPDFKPHLTLSYSPKDIDEKKISVKWKVAEIVLWCGDQDDEQMIVSIPFKFGKKASGIDEMCLYATLFDVLNKKN